MHGVITACAIGSPAAVATPASPERSSATSRSSRARVSLASRRSCGSPPRAARPGGSATLPMPPPSPRAASSPT
eukprot:10884427-Alexandrium_andersonii.AAC.1